VLPGRIVAAWVAEALANAVIAMRMFAVNTCLRLRKFCIFLPSLKVLHQSE
jgi:hypothetical protein